MAERLVGRASVSVAGSRKILWEVLLRPETVCKIMPVAEVLSGWSLGGPFWWKLDMLGKSYDLKGTVLRLEPDRLLEYEYLDPLAAKAGRVGHRHRVTIELSDEGTRRRGDESQRRPRHERGERRGGVAAQVTEQVALWVHLVEVRFPAVGECLHVQSPARGVGRKAQIGPLAAR
jgi:hypothetical protein